MPRMIWADEKIQSVNPSARYDADISYDAGRTWSDAGFYQCGAGVQVDMAAVLEGGGDVQVAGRVVVVVEYDGTLTRWVPRV